MIIFNNIIDVHKQLKSLYIATGWLQKTDIANESK